MRVSTGMIYQAGTSAIQRQTADMLHTQQQLSTGRRILTPADDPVAAARALEVTQAKSVNEQYTLNQGAAKDALGLAENKLAAVVDLIQHLQERAVQGGNGTLNASDRQSIAADLRSAFDELMGLANSTDGNGQYLFSGYQGNTVPFSGDVAAGVAYAGDDGQRRLQVGPSRQIPVSDAGSDVFLRIQDSTGASRSLFETVGNLATALETESGSTLSASVNTAIGDLSLALDNVLRVQADVGSRLREIDALASVTEDLDLQYATTLSRLQDVDYAQAISDLTLQQTYLEAAQKSFLRVSSLSLFNFI